jgi:hypothetical protein
MQAERRIIVNQTGVNVRIDMGTPNFGGPVGLDGQGKWIVEALELQAAGGSAAGTEVRVTAPLAGPYTPIRGSSTEPGTIIIAVGEERFTERRDLPKSQLGPNGAELRLDCISDAAGPPESRTVSIECRVTYETNNPGLRGYDLQQFVQAVGQAIIFADADTNNPIVGAPPVGGAPIQISVTDV